MQAGKKKERSAKAPTKQPHANRTNGVAKPPHKDGKHLASQKNVSPDAPAHKALKSKPLKAGSKTVKQKGKPLHKGKSKPQHSQPLKARADVGDSSSDSGIMDDEFDDAVPSLSDDSGQIDDFHSAREASSSDALQDGDIDSESSGGKSGDDDMAVRFLHVSQSQKNPQGTIRPQGADPAHLGSVQSHHVRKLETRHSLLHKMPATSHQGHQAHL
jgi:hypothetical protein